MQKPSHRTSKSCNALVLCALVCCQFSRACHCVCDPADRPRCDCSRCPPAPRWHAGRLDFGLTEGELLSLGIVCIIVGFILCINPILYAQQIYGLCEADKRRGSGKEPAFTGLGGIGDETHDDEGGDDDGGDDDGKLAELGGDRYMDAVHAARGGASGDGGVELTDRR